MRLDPQTCILLSLYTHGPAHRALIRDRVRSSTSGELTFTRETLEPAIRALVDARWIEKCREIDDSTETYISRLLNASCAGRPNVYFRLTIAGRAEASHRRNILLSLLASEE